jgi:AraC family transcriptional regulator
MKIDNAKNSRYQTIYIKNMVCGRCIRVVREELTNLGIKVIEVKLGEATLALKPKLSIEDVKNALTENGFELIEDKRAKIVEKIKNVIIELVHHSAELELLRENYSRYIEEHVGQSYNSLSKLFSSLENTTIEKYLILQKIEKVKELLVYGELTLSEIAYKLGYSSVQHLSNQFKQITGFTPSSFKEIKRIKRNSIDRVK